jgi:hypothetical protein
MILAFTKSPARRLATVGLVAVLFAGCATPYVTRPLAVGRCRPYRRRLRPTRSAHAWPGRLPDLGAVRLHGKATVTMTTNFGNMIIAVDGSLGAQRGGRFIALAAAATTTTSSSTASCPGFIIQAGDGTYARMPGRRWTKMGTGGPAGRSRTTRSPPPTSAAPWPWPERAHPTRPARSSSSSWTTRPGGQPRRRHGQQLRHLRQRDQGHGRRGPHRAVPTGGDPVIDPSTGQAQPVMPIQPVLITSTDVTEP